MSTVSIQELAQNPAALLARVEAGERLIVVRGDRPVAESRPVAAPRSTPRPFGLAAGAFVVPLPDDVLQGFEG